MEVNGEGKDLFSIGPFFFQEESSTWLETSVT
jgi:hypothetical protein